MEIAAGGIGVVEEITEGQGLDAGESVGIWNDLNQARGSLLAVLPLGSRYRTSGSASSSGPVSLDFRYQLHVSPTGAFVYHASIRDGPAPPEPPVASEA